MKIGWVICFLGLSFFGLSQSNDLSLLKSKLSQDDKAAFWEHSIQIINQWNKELDNQTNASLVDKSISSSRFIKNLGEESKREAHHNLSIQRKNDVLEKERTERKRSLLVAINNLAQRRALGDEGLVIKLMEEFVSMD